MTPIIIAVGTTNPIKLEAAEILKSYRGLYGAKIVSCNVASGVSEQPRSLEETILGARTRAFRAFMQTIPREGLFGVGIESGLLHVPYTQTGFMDVCAVVIHDGPNYHLGLSSAFECPKDVMELVLKEGLDLNEAFYRTGRTGDRKVGSKEGAIGVLTRGRVTRKEYTEQAIKMAMIHLNM